MQLQALMMFAADAQKTQELVTLVPWTFILQILNLFLQMYLIKRSGKQERPKKKQILSRINMRAA